MAPETGSLQEELDLPGTLPQVPVGGRVKCPTENQQKEKRHEPFPSRGTACDSSLAWPGGLVCAEVFICVFKSGHPSMVALSGQLSKKTQTRQQDYYSLPSRLTIIWPHKARQPCQAFHVNVDSS